MSAGFLIDECVSPTLVRVAKTRGLNAMHVTYIGMAGAGDWAVTALAVERDLICVTIDEEDYLATYARQDVHPGLAIIVPDQPREVQSELFSLLLDWIERSNDDLTNKVIKITERGEIILRDWPDPETL